MRIEFPPRADPGERFTHDALDHLVGQTITLRVGDVTHEGVLISVAVLDGGSTLALTVDDDVLPWVSGSP